MKIETFKLNIPGEIEVTFLNYGGIIQKILVPDKHGNMGDVVLGFDDPVQYLDEHPYFGALIGRYANRISRGIFTLDKKTYHLATNNGPNALHGGKNGFDKLFWQVQELNDLSYSLSLKSPDGDEGYPGNLNVEVTYTLTHSRELVIDYQASTDHATPVNLTNHSYFNLAGESEDFILDHELWINADEFTEVDNDLIPTGRLISVSGPMDFRERKAIGKDIANIPGGYDHNYALNQAPLRDPKARVFHPASGRLMEVFTTCPGMQFYSGNFLDGTLRGKKNRPYKKHSGLCLETQHFPDSPNHPEFPDTILRPGHVFKSKTIYRFSS